MVVLKLPTLIKNFNKLSPNEYNTLFKNVNKTYQYGDFHSTQLYLKKLILYPLNADENEEHLQESLDASIGEYDDVVNHYVL